MELPATSVEYIMIPFEGPDAYPDLSIYPSSIALMPDNGAEPGGGDWVAAQWLPNTEGVLEPAVLQNRWPAGLYMAWARVVAGPETVVRRSGRVRIGDTRT